MKNPKPNPFRLKGDIALITGGGSGIGLAIAESMVDAGARVILVGRRELPLTEASSRLGSRASCLVHDVSDGAASAHIAERASEIFGPISILVNNAGVHLKRPALSTTEAEFQTLLSTHVLGAHSLVRALVPSMLERRRGSVLFIASMASLFGFPNVVAYSAAKSAVVGMVRSLATEFSASGVRINAIAPGWIDSAMMRRALAGDPKRKQRILSRTPMRRFGKADEIHHHPDTEQIFYILEGGGILTIGEEESKLTIGEGDVVRIPPGTLHPVEGTDARGIKYLRVDCFLGPVPAGKSTWDLHIKAACAAEGWDFTQVRENG